MNIKTILICLGLCLFLPSISQGGGRITPADQPVPVLVPEPPKNIEYEVKSGDTLGRIGKKHGVSVKEILAVNKGVDPNKLKIGQKVVIPGKSAETAAKKPVVVEKITAEVQAKDAASAKSGKTNAAAPEKEKTLTKAKLVPAEPAAPAEKIVAAKPGKSAPGKTEAKVEAPVVKTQTAPAAPAEKAAVTGKDAKKVGKQPVSRTVAAIQASPPKTSTGMKAYGKTGVIMNDTDVPMAIRQEFNAYGQKWLDVCEQLAIGTKNNKKVRKIGDKWEASYRIIQKNTLGSEVKRVHYDHTPYVGHLTYGVLAYVSIGSTKEAALNGSYEEKEEHMREIFSYDGKKKAWR